MIAVVVLIACLLGVATSQQSCSVNDAASNSTFSEYLLTISQQPGNASPERAIRMDYISSVFQGFGLNVTRENVTGPVLCNKDLIYTFTNVFGRLTPKGSDDKTPLIIVSAHYDTVQGTVGLYDNSAGVAAVLEAARVLTPALNKLNKPAEVWFVAWDGEELCISGSAAWFAAANSNVTKRIVGVYNLDSVGFISQVPDGQKLPAGVAQFLPDVAAEVASQQNRPNFLAILMDPNSFSLGFSFNATAFRCKVPIRVIPIPIPLSGAQVCASPQLIDFCRSDHEIFWTNGLPAVHLTDTANLRNPCYHGACDNQTELSDESWKFLMQTTSVLAQTVYDSALTFASNVTDTTVTNTTVATTTNPSGTQASSGIPMMSATANMLVAIVVFTISASLW